MFGIKKYPKQNQTGSDKIQIAVTMIVNLYCGIVASIKDYVNFIVRAPTMKIYIKAARCLW